MEADEVLRVVGAVGPYFEVVTDPVGPTWRPLAALAGTVLDERVEHLRTVLANRTGLAVDVLDRRACASTDFLGVASRVLAPALGAVAVAGTALAPSELFWQLVDGGPAPIAWTGAIAARPVDDADAAAEALIDGVIEPFVGPLVQSYLLGFRLSPKVVWGDVSSALAGAAGTLARRGSLQLDPVEIVDSLLARSELTGTGEYVQPDPDRRERFFVRNNCCLLYRVPGGGKCGDCVLVRRAERELLWRELLDRAR